MFLFKHVPSFTGMQKMASACKYVIHFDATLLGALVMKVRVEVTALAKAEYALVYPNAKDDVNSETRHPL